MFCQHREIFGKPREGSHKYRIPLLDVALVDVALTLLIGFLISLLIGASFGYTSLTLSVAGILAHRLFGVSTKVDNTLFGPPHPCIFKPPI